MYAPEMGATRLTDVQVSAEMEQLPGFRLPDDAVDVDTVRADADRADGLAHLKRLRKRTAHGIAHAVAVGRRVYPLAAGGAVELAREDSGRSLFPRDAVRAGQFALQAGAGDERQGGLRFCGLVFDAGAEGAGVVVFVRFPAPRGVAVVSGEGDARGAKGLAHGQRLAQRAQLRAGHAHAVPTRRGTTCPWRWKSTAPSSSGSAARSRFRLGIGIGSDVAAKAQRQLFGFGGGQLSPRPRMAAPSWAGALRRSVRRRGRRRRRALASVRMGASAVSPSAMAGKAGDGGEIAIRRNLGPRLRRFRRLGRGVGVGRGEALCMGAGLGSSLVGSGDALRVGAGLGRESVGSGDALWATGPEKARCPPGPDTASGRTRSCRKENAPTSTATTAAAAARRCRRRRISARRRARRTPS